MKAESNLKRHVLALFEGKGAHVEMEEVLKRIPVEQLGRRFKNVPYTLWQLFEHIRLSQKDLLEYAIDPNYRWRTWPDEYWPQEKAPKEKSAWQKALEDYRKDVRAIRSLIKNSKTDLFEKVPSGKKPHTVLREILLMVDHNAYHLGQMVVMLRMLGAWERES